MDRRTVTDIPALKARAARRVDAHATELAALGNQLFATPELGFKEHKTSALVRTKFDEMGLVHHDGIAITGTRADIIGGAPGPTVAIFGELDSLLSWDHPDRDRLTGAVHACGHNAQLATMLGAGIALQEIAPELAGRVALFAVPAEEYVELEERLAMRRAGKVEFLGGKAEFTRLGIFDDIDVAMMVHTSSEPEDGLFAVGITTNGMVAKFVRYTGRASHAGGDPDRGINALYAAHIGLAGINALRETFRESDHVRVHPIITKGGDIVNAIPADVRLEMFCRASTSAAVVATHEKVDRALKAGALALGAEVEIMTLAGYLPLDGDANLLSLFRKNAEAIVGKDQVTSGGHRGGCTDMGDVSHFLPTLHPWARGAEGASHGADYRITDYGQAVVNPAKALAFTAIDLLADGAREARRVKAEFKPKMTSEQYLAHMRRFTTSQNFKASDV